MPSSPPDTPQLKVSGPDDGNGGQKATAETKEELARRLRRVASAPNGLFKSNDGSKHAADANGERPATAELGKDPLIEDLATPGTLSMVEAKVEAAKNQSLGLPSEDVLAGLPPPPNSGLAFRRTYSSNSIKVRSVEVNPSSFDKVKLIGKGDVGKVYLVKEKKSNRLYAMKGNAMKPFKQICTQQEANLHHSVEQEGDDQAKQDQASPRGARDSSHQQPPIYRYTISFFPVRRSSLPLYGILQWWRVLPCSADTTWQMYCRGRCSLLCRRGYSRVGVPASHGLHLSRLEARE